MKKLSSLVRVLSVALLSAVGAADLSAQSSQSWTQWRGADRQGQSPYVGLNKNWNERPPQLLWTAEGIGEGYASVTLAGGKIFTTGNLADGQYVFCLADGTETPLWKTKVTEGAPKHGYEGSRCTPTLDGTRVYAVSSDGQICCLEQATGAVVWKRDFARDFGGKMMSGWGFSESPLVDGNRVICTPGGGDALLVALDKATGEEIWRSAAPGVEGTDAKGKDLRGGAAYASIVISEGAGTKQYVQLFGGGMVGVRAEDGKPLWSYFKIANSIANIPTPVPFGDYVFASTGYGAGAALVQLEKAGDGVTAKEVYFLDQRVFQNHHGGMVKVGDYIYAGHKHGEGFPVCIEAMTGKIVWGGEIRGAGKGSAAVLYVDGCLIFRYQSGDVALIEATPKEYRLLGKFMPAHQEKDSWAHPVVVNGKLYLREQNKLMCYDVSAAQNVGTKR